MAARRSASALALVALAGMLAPSVAHAGQLITPPVQGGSGVTGCDLVYYGSTKNVSVTMTMFAGGSLVPNRTNTYKLGPNNRFAYLAKDCNSISGSGSESSCMFACKATFSVPVTDMALVICSRNNAAERDHDVACLPGR
jgi:hypothetical protein